MKTTTTKDAYTIKMSNSQELYNPHWIVRFSDDFMNAVLKNANAPKTETYTRDNLINAICTALKLKAEDFDFNCLKASAKADTSKVETVAQQRSTAEFITLYKAQIAKMLAEKKQNITLAQLKESISKHVPTEEQQNDILKAFCSHETFETAKFKTAPAPTEFLF